MLDDTFQPKEKAVVYLRRLIDLSKARGVELVLLQTPLHTEYRKAAKDRNDAFVGYMTDLANEFGISFFDFSALYDDGSLFF